MSALNFKKEFAEDVRTGRKRQTIRRERKNPIRRGEMLFLYTGMRTKNCELLRKNFCHEVSKIIIDNYHIQIDYKHEPQIHTSISVLNREAQKDGFKNWEEMAVVDIRNCCWPCWRFLDKKSNDSPCFSNYI